MDIIAHRGFRKYPFPENTMQAFENSVNLRADYIEFDLRKTRDGKIVVFHDTSIYMGYVSLLSYSTLCKLCTEFTPPLFEDVIAKFAGRIKFDVEIKSFGIEDEVTRILSKLPYDDYMITSFSPRIIARIKVINHKIRTGLIIGHSVFLKSKLEDCSPNYIIVRQSVFDKIYSKYGNSYGIYVWDVDKSSDLCKYSSYSNVKGIICDE